MNSYFLGFLLYFQWLFFNVDWYVFFVGYETDFCTQILLVAMLLSLRDLLQWRVLNPGTDWIQALTMEKLTNECYFWYVCGCQILLLAKLKLVKIVAWCILYYVQVDVMSWWGVIMSSVFKVIGRLLISYRVFLHKLCMCFIMPSFPKQRNCFLLWWFCPIYSQMPLVNPAYNLAKAAL